MDTEKEEIRRKLKDLRKLGITREVIGEEGDWSPCYINQMMGKGGKLPPTFIQLVNTIHEREMKPVPMTAPIRTRRAKADSANTLYIQRKEDSAFTEYARRMEAAEFFHEVEGDAMHPLIMRGDGLLLVEIEKEVIVGGEAYVIELRSGLTVVRYLKFDDGDPQKLLLVSYNKAAGDTMVRKEDVRRLFKIVLKISK